MKHILLGEGKYDAFLLRKFYERERCEIDTFLREEFGRSAYRNEQTNCVRSFIERRSPYDVLIKSEGGKTPLIEFVTTEIVHLIRNIDKVVLVIDLDSKDEEGVTVLKDNLSEKIKDKHRGSDFEVQSVDKINENEQLIAVKMDIESVGDFIVIGCKPNLEDIARIDRQNDTRDVKKEKILRILDDNCSFFQDILLT